MRHAAVAVAATLLVSGILGGAASAVRLGEERDRWAGVPDVEAARAAIGSARLSPAAFEFVAPRLRAGDRYYVHTPTGERVILANEGAIVRTYAAYALLPAVQVASPGEANVVVAYDAEPEELDLVYASVERFSGDVRASVARVAR